MENFKKLAIGLVIATSIGFAAHWSIGLIIAIAVIYQSYKTPDSTSPPGEKKPFLARFGDTFKMPACFETKKEAMAQPCDINATGNFDQEVVGESNYKTTIWSCIPSEHAKADKFRLYFVATLEQEDDNEYDKNAVAVKINKGTVGYIPRTEARKFRNWSNNQNLGKTATCRAVVVGNKGKDYSIWLDLPT